MTPWTPLRLVPIVAVAAMALALSGCGGGDDAGAVPDTSDAESGDAAVGGDGVPGGEVVGSESVFPVTIEHVYGTTTITERPERVATVAWANHEVPLALGVVPVGMSMATWGDDDGDGVLPWVEDALVHLGAETPVLFDETDGIDFEAIADTDPDVILAAYSGITREEYDTLSAIAPTVAYPEVAWGTSMQDMIRLNSAALGLASEGDALIEELDGVIDDAVAKHPELRDTKVLFAFIDPMDLSQVGFYTSHDTRPGFLESIGFPTPEVVQAESAGTTGFYVTVSSELADRFGDVDLFVTYGSADGSIIDRLQADPLLSTIPAVAAGSIAILENSTPLAASANPSPLSIRWGVEEYFALLADGVRPTR